MKKTRLLLIGKIALELILQEESLDPPFLRFAGDRAGRSADGPPFRLKVEEDLPIQAAELPEDSQPLSIFTGPEGVINFRTAALEGSLNIPTRMGTIRQTPGSRGYQAGLQILLSQLLVDHGRILIHGAGLEKQGSAFLFVGPSGAGKSTVAQLSALPMFSDEMCCIHTHRDAPPSLSGTPFGRCTLEAERPLTAIYWLEQAPVDALEPLHPAEALRLLFGQTVMGTGDSVHLARLFGLTAELVRRVPVHRLRFTLSRNFMGLINDTAYSN